MQKLLDEHIEAAVKTRWPNSRHPETSPVYKSRRQAVAADIVAGHVRNAHGPHLAPMLAELIRSGVLVVNGNPGPVPIGVPKLAPDGLRDTGGRFEIAGRFIATADDGEGRCLVFAEVLAAKEGAEAHAAQMVALANATSEMVQSFRSLLLLALQRHDDLAALAEAAEGNKPASDIMQARHAADYSSRACELAQDILARVEAVADA